MVTIQDRIVEIMITVEKHIESKKSYASKHDIIDYISTAVEKQIECESQEPPKEEELAECINPIT